MERLISWYYYIRAPWYLFTFKNGNQTEFKGNNLAEAMSKLS